MREIIVEKSKYFREWFVNAARFHAHMSHLIMHHTEKLKSRIIDIFIKTAHIFSCVNDVIIWENRNKDEIGEDKGWFEWKHVDEPLIIMQ